MSEAQNTKRIMGDQKVAIVIDQLNRHLIYSRELGGTARKVLDMLKTDGTNDAELKGKASNAIAGQEEGDSTIAKSAAGMARLMFEDMPAKGQIVAYSKLMKGMNALASSLEPTSRKVVQQAMEFTLAEIKDKTVMEKVKAFMESEKI